MLDFIERCNLIILNAMEECEGFYTRVQGGENSVIDCFHVNDKMYDTFRRRNVDECKEEYDMCLTIVIRLLFLR